jgi:hypothetical protein
MRLGTRLRRRVSAAIFALALAALAALTARRAVGLASDRTARDAVGELRFYHWAYRDPRLIRWLSEESARLSPGEAVLATCAPECDTGWLWVMGAYGMPRQAVVASKTSGELERMRIRPARFEWTRSGVRLVPRGAADGDR